MRRTTSRLARRCPPLLALALALWAAHAVGSAPARADIILAPLPASAVPVHFADQDPAASVVGVDPIDGISVTVAIADRQLLRGIAAVDGAGRYVPTGPEGFLTLTSDRPIYGIAFAFGNPLSGFDTITAGGGSFPVGTLFGTPGGSVSLLATGGDTIRSVTVSSGFVGGVFDLRILARPVAVPEPAGLATFALGGAGLVGAWGWRRRRRAA